MRNGIVRKPGEKVSSRNLRKKATDREFTSEAEVWFAIRYLDPELRRTSSDEITAYFALFMVIAVVCVVWFSLHLRGL